MPNIIDALAINDINRLRENLSFYFEEIAYAIKNDNTKIDCLEYYAFSITDILTSYNYSLPREYRNKFLEIIDSMINTMQESIELCEDKY